MHLTILIPVKDVPAHLRLSGGRLTRQGVPHRLDPVNQIPLEWARNLRSAGTSVRVIAVTMGPPAAVGALRMALALGADEALHITGDALAGADVRTTARALSATARMTGADVVACGYESADGSSGAVPSAIAAYLDRPLLSRATTATLTESALTVRRDLGAGPEEATAPLPAVVSFVEGGLEPAHPSLREVLRTRSAVPTTLSAAALGLNPPAESAMDVRAQAARTRHRATTVVGLDQGVDLLVGLLTRDGANG